MLKIRSKTALSITTTALLAVAVNCARAELVELTNGLVLQGDVNAGQTSDEGLAVNLYDTGGTVVVKWTHIVESRRKQLRLENGIDLPEETVELVDGHRALLIDGTKIMGVALNDPRGSEPLRLKTRSGVKEYDRTMLAGKVEDEKIDGLLVYTVEELYQLIRDKNPPETAAAHKALAQRCFNIGAFVHEKEHLLAAKEDKAFMETAEGKAVDAMLRNADIMIRAQGATELVTQIKQAMAGSRHNDALKILDQLDKEYKDEVIRKTINFDLLEARVFKARDTWFNRAVQMDVYKAMDTLIEAKAREKKPLRQPQTSNDPMQPGSGPQGPEQGSLAAARQWENRELDNLIWDKVAANLGLKKDELDKYWKQKSVKNVRRTGYGSGSFIVVKKAQTGKAGGPQEPQRRRPPTPNNGGGGSKNAPPKPAKVEKPLTDEEWWDIVGPEDRKRWLTANFVETSGRFEILQTPQINCDKCAGQGFTKTTGTDGNEDQTFCHQCNACGVERKVNYR